MTTILNYGLPNPARRTRVLLKVATSLLVILTLSGCQKYKDSSPPPALKSNELLKAHTRHFQKRVEKVTEGIYSAIGFALANSMLIVTEDGNVIVDATESVEAAREIKKEFAKIAPQPTRALIYTHGHPDHFGGATALARPDTEIHAHKKFMTMLSSQFGELQPTLIKRGMRQFGVYLPKEDVLNDGIGPYLRWSAEEPPTPVMPNKFFDGDKDEFSLGGQKLLLFYAPGETDDHIFIWLPEKKALFCGDNYYAAFPNLYTIRGTPSRPVNQWYKSIDKMRDLKPEYLIPSHGPPIIGAARISEVLTAYRDGIQYLHDAVIRGANQGKTLDQMAHEITLPPHLAAYPELRELYGQISWSVRSIYDGYLGWFDGNATNLDRLSAKERGQRWIRLAGGAQKLLDEARDAVEAADWQWAAELADLLLAVEPDRAAARDLKIKALTGLGESSSNANARNYYLTQAYELQGKVNLPARVKITAKRAHAVPLSKIFEIMPTRLDPAASADKMLSVGFKITDSQETYQVHVRRGVAEIRPGFPEKADLVIQVRADVWKEIALGVTDARQAYLRGDVKVEGGLLKLMEFGNLFQRD